jgi:Lysyl oxidase
MSRARRTAIALALSMLGVVTAVAAASPAQEPPPSPSDLLPDLRAIRATDFSFQVIRGGRRLVRLTTEVGNVGRGPFDLRPVAGDCDGDGDARNDRLAYQRVYADANGDGVYGSSVDTAFRDRLAGCMHHHPAHDHWHFKGFAGYSLVNRRNGRTVASTNKVSFCALDTDPRWPELPGFTSLGGYLYCEANRPQGISVGWGDIYGSGLPGQFLDLTGVGPGRYCVVTVADPQGRVQELNEANNGTGTSLRLRKGGRLGGSGRPC